MISFVLLEPQTPGNIGAVARVMKNFGFSRLVIINPKCDPNCKEAMDRSKHSSEILKSAVVAPKSILSSFHTVIATTSKVGSDYNIPRSPVTPQQLCLILPKKGFRATGSPNIALLFGSEGDGLSNKDIQDADIVVTIPCDGRYAALNLSHAVAIMAYELSKVLPNKKVQEHIALASSKERKIMLDLMGKLIDTIHFTTAEKRETQRKVWKRIFSKSFMSRREAYAVMGFLRKLLGGIK